MGANLILELAPVFMGLNSDTGEWYKVHLFIYIHLYLFSVVSVDWALYVCLVIGC